MSARRIPLPRDSRAAHDERALRRMRQKVQIAKKQFGLADEDYRAVLLRVTGKASSTLCGPSDLEALLKEFRRLGWKNTGGRKPPSAKAQVRMIHAVFADLKPFLASGGDESTLRAFVKRQTKTPATPDGVDAPEFLDSVQANKVLEGLKAWLRRERERRRA